ncbi:hypothetical protein IGI04_026399, partial [Brassica rapa subsp. trilocularis]
FSDLRLTLKDFSEDFRNTSRQEFLEDFWKTLRRLPKKYSNVFYARKRLTKSSGSLQEVFRKSSGSLPKFSAQSYTNCGYKTFGRLFETLGRLLADFLRSLLMYFMLEDFSRSLQEAFQSLMPKVVQRNDVKWRPSLSMLRDDI